MRKRQGGFIDPLSLISLGFLVVSLLVGAVVVNKQNANYDIRNKAALAEPCKVCQGTGCVTIAFPPNCTGSLNECSQNSNCQTTTPTTAPTSAPTNAPTSTSTPTCGGLYDPCCGAYPSGSCNSGLYCSNIDGGTCLTKVCNLGNKQCSGNSLGICKSDGSGYNYSLCTYGCSNGACITPTPTPTPTPNYTCGNTSGQWCSPEGCSASSGECYGTGSCAPGRSCCKVCPTPTPTRTPTPTNPPTNGVCCPSNSSAGSVNTCKGLSKPTCGNQSVCKWEENLSWNDCPGLKPTPTPAGLCCVRNNLTANNLSSANGTCPGASYSGCSINASLCEWKLSCSSSVPTPTPTPTPSCGHLYEPCCGSGSCNSGLYCGNIDGGTCMTKVCTAGQKQCSGSSLGYCKADGSGWIYSLCLYGCANNACISVPSPTPTPTPTPFPTPTPPCSNAGMSGICSSLNCCPGLTKVIGMYGSCQCKVAPTSSPTPIPRCSSFGGCVPVNYICERSYEQLDCRDSQKCGVHCSAPVTPSPIPTRMPTTTPTSQCSNLCKADPCCKCTTCDGNTALECSAVCQNIGGTITTPLGQMECTPGTKLCSSGNLKICSTSGTWGLTTCSSGCANSACKPPPAAPAIPESVYYIPGTLPPQLAAVNPPNDPLSLTQDPMMAASLNQKIQDCLNKGFSQSQCSQAFQEAANTKDTCVAFYMLENPGTNLNQTVKRCNQERANAAMTAVATYGALNTLPSVTNTASSVWSLAGGNLANLPSAAYFYATAALATTPWLQTAAAVATLSQLPASIIACQTQGADSPACQYAAMGITAGYYSDVIGSEQALQSSAQQVQQVANQGLNELSYASSILNLPNADNPAGWTLETYADNTLTHTYFSQNIISERLQTQPLLLSETALQNHPLLLPQDDIGASADMFQINPETVIKTFRNSDPVSLEYFLNEYNGALILDKLGVGPKIYSPVITSSGRFGYEMEFLHGNFPENVPQFINAVTLPSLTENIQKIQQAGYVIGDFQYFIQPSGSTIIIDPASMRPLGSFGIDDWSAELIRQQDWLINLQNLK